MDVSATNQPSNRDSISLTSISVRTRNSATFGETTLAMVSCPGFLEYRALEHNLLSDTLVMEIFDSSARYSKSRDYDTWHDWWSNK